MPRRHLDPLARELRGHAVELREVVIEGGIVQAVSRPAGDVVGELHRHAGLDSRKALGAGIGECRQAVDRLGYDEVLEAHQEGRDIEAEVPIHPARLHPALDAPGGLWLEQAFAFTFFDALGIAETEVERRRLERVAVVRIQANRVASTRPGVEHHARAAAQADVRFAMLSLAAVHFFALAAIPHFVGHVEAEAAVHPDARGGPPLEEAVAPAKLR